MLRPAGNRLARGECPAWAPDTRTSGDIEIRGGLEYSPGDNAPLDWPGWSQLWRMLPLKPEALTRTRFKPANTKPKATAKRVFTTCTKRGRSFDHGRRN